MINTFLSFKICNEFYAVNVAHVLEVLEKQSITPVPNSPNYILGIINFRGVVVPVYDSRVKFSHPERDPNASFVIIVFDLSKNEQNIYLGAMVDRVNDVISVDDSEIKTIPPMSSEFNTEFLEGVIKLENRFLLLVNTEKVFSDGEILNLHQADIIS